jgi:hypothetical protein
MTPKRLIDWKRFSLRSLFVLMTLCCLVFGLWAAYVNPYRLQANSLVVVNRLQGNAATSPADGPGWQRWLVTAFLGNDAFVRVTEVDLANREVDDGALGALAGLVHLEKLALDYTRVSDAGVAALRSMRELKHLSLRYTNVSNRAAEQLAALRNLKTMILTGTELSDGAVDDLAKHDQLAELYIRWTQISDSGAERLAAALPKCAVHHHALTRP